MVKLNEKLSQIRPSVEPSMILSEILEQILHTPPSPPDFSPRVEYEYINRFYEDYYVPLDDLGGTLKNHSGGEVQLSSHERQLINFCKAPSSETRILVVHGHTGVGKSSLVRRLVFYVYPKCPDFQSLVVPVYVPITPEFADKNATQLDESLRRAVVGSDFPRIKKEFLGDLERILNFLNEYSELFGDFSQSDFRRAAKDLERWVQTKFSKRQVREQFYFEILKALIRLEKLRVVLFVDDVDRYSPETHNRIFWVLDTLAACGIQSVVCMRTSTYRNIAAEFMQYLDREIEIRLHGGILENILMRRVMNVREKEVRLSPEVAFRIPELERVTIQEIADVFCDLLSQRTSVQTLVSLSNTNITSVFKKLTLMARSEAFSDKFMVHQILEKRLMTSVGVHQKSWILYHLLLGNHAGTFRRCPETTKAGLLNIFDSDTPSTNPWRHFIRLHILLYLYRRSRESVDEEYCVPVKEIRQRMWYVFGPSPETIDLLMDAIYALVRGELVFTQSRRRYQTLDDFQRHITEDSLQISTAGQFYLDNFVHKVEYLYFVKDDIDWDVDKIPSAMKPADRDYIRPAKFASVLEALRLLLMQELVLLGRLKGRWVKEPEYRLRMACYRENFSPYRLGVHVPRNNQLLITEFLLFEYDSFIRNRLGGGYAGSDVQIIVDAMNGVINDHEALKQAYLQA